MLTQLLSAKIRLLLTVFLTVLAMPHHKGGAEKMVARLDGIAERARRNEVHQLISTNSRKWQEYDLAQARVATQ